MKHNRFDWLGPAPGQLVAAFGNARLVKSPDGKLELRGGSAQDPTAAKEWISLFFHDGILRVMPAVPSGVAGANSMAGQ